MHQGWPNLVSSLWMSTADGGLAAVAYAPSEVEAILGESAKVRLAEDTEYPFRESVQLTVNPENAITFPLKLRIPSWATGATVAVNGTAVNDVRSGSNLVINREWSHGQPGEGEVADVPSLT